MLLGLIVKKMALGFLESCRSERETDAVMLAVACTHTSTQKRYSSLIGGLVRRDSDPGLNDS
jgi:hypothetical protein